MRYSIKWFSEEEKQAYKREHYLSQPRNWAIMHGAMIYSFHDTEEEANAELATPLRQQDCIIQDLFDKWLADTATQFGITKAELEVIIREHF